MGIKWLIHVPLSLEAQAEARLLMFSHMNLLSPAIGDPVSDLLQERIMSNFELSIIYFMEMASQFEEFSHKYSISSGLLSIEVDQEKKGSIEEEIHAFFVEIRAKDLLRDFLELSALLPWKIIKLPHGELAAPTNDINTTVALAYPRQRHIFIRVLAKKDWDISGNTFNQLQYFYQLIS
ncbi:DNA-directed RNA polymerase subunit beta' [Platanthera zijinensis]|uniref:DNA-directed RNA polymerase subunit beta n=1 Tax=Platanthera zijinensis TaxID=2320716 RepID=A0AAP0B423_9ASPA